MLLGIKLPWRTVQTYLFDLCLIAWSVEFVKASTEHINHAAGLMDPVGQFFERNAISERKSSGSASTRKETSFGSEVKKAPSLGFAAISEMNNGGGVVRLGDLDFGLSRCRWQSRQSAERACSSLAGAMTGCNARKFQRTSPALAG